VVMLLTRTPLGLSPRLRQPCRHRRSAAPAADRRTLGRCFCAGPPSAAGRSSHRRRRWRLPLQGLIQLDGGRHYCAKRGVVVDPRAGTELALVACDATAALVRRHAWRLISASVYISLGVTCVFAELLNEGEHRETLRSEMADLRAQLGRCRVMERHSAGHAAEAVDLTLELNEALADCRQLDMMRDSMMNWTFAFSYGALGCALLCRPGCALRPSVLLGCYAGVGLPLASVAAVAIAQHRRRELDWMLLCPPPPFTHFVQRGASSRGWW
jgi:hypothetical protein